ncbi:MAG: preprotein translocase subunit TatB [Micromonosporaceae bacterium]|nr:preprotein translocase subunit TatB [Micromonosporaceae bacterium]
MFDNLNWWEIGALLLLALLIFGERLPSVISDGLRMLRSLRAMARNATSDLSRELGTDIKLEDLHPKSFIRKHLLSEEDEAALRRPLQSVYNEVKKDLTGIKSELKEVADAADLRSGTTGSASSPAPAADPSPNGSGTLARRTFDADAT